MDNCPKCGSSWIGEEIPENMKESCGGTHWKREIGIDGGYMGIYDGEVAYKCPDCQEYVPTSKAPWAMEMFNKFMGILNETK